MVYAAKRGTQRPASNNIRLTTWTWCRSIKWTRTMLYPYNKLSRLHPNTFYASSFFDSTMNARMWPTSLPDNCFDRIPSNRTCHHQRLPRNNSFLLHGANERQTVNVQFGSMFSWANFRWCNTLVEAPIVGMNRRYVKVWDDFTIHCYVLANLQSV